MLKYLSVIVEEEFVTSIGHSDEFYVNLLFDRYIYRPMCSDPEIWHQKESMRSMPGIRRSDDLINQHVFPPI